MSELQVDTIKPSFDTQRVTVTPGVVVKDAQQIEHFEVTSTGEIKVLGPLQVGTPITNTAGSQYQVLTSQGAALAPYWDYVGGASANEGDVLTSRGPGTAPYWSPTVPIGGIIMWYGTVSNIPRGWVLCNGQNGTPDLRDRFVVGAGNSYQPNAIGGVNSVSLTASQMADHTHGLGAYNSAGNNDLDIFGIRNRHWNDVGAINRGNVQTSAIDGDNVIGNASYTLAPSTINGLSTSRLSLGQIQTFGLSTVSSEKNGDPHENRPPYYALCYIMRVVPT